MKFAYVLLALCGLALPTVLTAQGAPPLNDECAEATTIALPTFGTTNYFLVDTRTATQTTPTPGCTTASADDDVWYAFEANSDGMIFRYRNGVLAEGSQGVGYALYDGCNGFEVACNFNFGDGSSGSEIVELFLPLVPGETYQLRLFTQNDEGGGTFEFGIQAYQSNDDCLGAEEIVVQIPGPCAFTNYSTENFSRSFVPVSACARTSNNDDGWYSFQATSEFVVINYENLIATTGTSSGLGFSIHDGCSGMELACDFSLGDGSSGSEVANPLNPLNPGQTYILRLYLEGPTSAGTFDFCLQESACRPPFVRYEVIFDACETEGPKVVTSVFDIGSGDSLLVVNQGNLDTLVFKSTGRDTTIAFATEGSFLFTAINQQSSDCNQTETVDVYCPADNQSCTASRPLNINDPGSCDLLNEAKNWNAATSEYPLDPSCGFYKGGDLFYTFTAPTPTLVFEILENPFSTMALSVNELNCDDGGLEIDCQTISSDTGTRTLSGFTVGSQYTLRVFDRSDNNFGTAVFCVQADISLPAELSEFTGQALAKSNQLAWQTASEVDVDRFELLRSDDGVSNWSTLIKVAATNNSDGFSYTALDDEPGTIKYYQLRTLDLDGSASLSAIISVKRVPASNALALNVFPNPASSDLYFTTSATLAHASLIGANGQFIRTVTSTEFSAGKISLHGLPTGLYTLRLVADQKQTAARFIHQ